MYNRISDLMKNKKEFAVCTVVEIEGSSPGKKGFKMIVFQDGSIEGTIGGGNIENIIREKAMNFLAKGKSGMFEYELKDVNMTCGGSIKVFIESIKQKQRIVIAGAGHIGRELLRICSSCEDFDIKAFDNREENVALLKEDYDINYLQDYKGIEDYLKQDDMLVVLTHGHSFDKDVLYYASKIETLFYTGCIGSKSKVGILKKELISMGASEDFVNNIYSPVGLDIGANSPFEISISILSELISIKNTGKTSCSLKV